MATSAVDADAIRALAAPAERQDQHQKKTASRKGRNQRGGTSR